MSYSVLRDLCCNNTWPVRAKRATFGTISTPSLFTLLHGRTARDKHEVGDMSPLVEDGRTCDRRRVWDPGKGQGPSDQIGSREAEPSDAPESPHRTFGSVRSAKASRAVSYPSVGAERRRINSSEALYVQVAWPSPQRGCRA